MTFDIMRSMLSCFIRFGWTVDFGSSHFHYINWCKYCNLHVARLIALSPPDHPLRDGLDLDCCGPLWIAPKWHCSHIVYASWQGSHKAQESLALQFWKWRKGKDITTRRQELLTISPSLCAEVQVWTVQDFLHGLWREAEPGHRLTTLTTVWRKDWPGKRASWRYHWVTKCSVLQASVITAWTIFNFSLHK